MSDYLTDTDSVDEISELRGEIEPDEIEMKERELLAMAGHFIYWSTFQVLVSTMKFFYSLADSSLHKSSSKKFRDIHGPHSSWVPDPRLFLLL